MTDKYYRLVRFVVDICADVLRKYFVKLAKTDAGNTYTSVEAYLSYRNRDVMQLFNKKKLRSDQYDLLYPAYDRADENKWDISILVTLITELFAPRLQPREHFALKTEILGIRNKLQNQPNTGNISDYDFDDYYGRLADSITLIAKNALDPNDEASLLGKINQMAYKYYRLVCFVVDICADVLRKYFVKLAKTDAGNTYTSVDAYLSHRKRDVMQLFNNKKLRRDQYDLLYPGNGSADENKWDISILVTLIIELFATRLQQLEIIALKTEILGIRNELQNQPNTGNISDDDFDDYWGRLADSITLIAKNAIDPNDEASLLGKINHVKSSHLPNLGECLRIWHEETSKQLLTIMNEMQANAEETTSILRQVTVQKPGPSGNKNKRIKVDDDILARLQAGFESTIKELSDHFNPPSEVTDIRVKLRDYHHVVVTGCNGSRYFDTALAAIKGMNFNYKRSVEMHTSYDWRHINPEDVDLVLCRDPFGGYSYDESKAKAMADIFKDMKHSTEAANGDKILDIVIVTDLTILEECKMHHDHEILAEVVKVFTDTSSGQPDDLTIGCGRQEQYAQSSLLPVTRNNLGAMTRHFLMVYKIPSGQVDYQILEKAKKSFQVNRAIVLTGHKECGKTSIAVALASAYDVQQCLLLKKPNDVNYIDFQNTALVIIDEFAGKYRYEENEVYEWYNMFDYLYNAVIAESINVIITCEKGKLDKCIDEVRRHAILEHVVDVSLQKAVVKSEVTEDNTIPDEIASDPRTREFYEKALQKGTEKDNIIRVMVIGCFGQGKTSLVRKLLKQSIEGVETTNGIDLHRCTVINDDDWKMSNNKDLKKETVQRLVNIALKETTYHTTSYASHGENCLPNKHKLILSSATDISKTTDESLTYQTSGIQKNDKSNEYEGKGRENVKTNRSQIAGAAETLAKNKKVNYENLNSFKTELEIVESIQEEIKLENNVTLNIWDFGGEFVYYATHQIFHSKQAVYLLVFNLSIALDTIIEDKEFPLHQKKMRDYLKFWVTSVSSFVGSKDGMEPAIVLVGTHTDKLNARSNSEDYFEHVRKIFDHSVCLYHIQPKQFPISNTNGSESEFDKLRSYITSLGQKQLETRIPAKWILLETALKMNKEKKIITIDKLLEIDSHTDSPLQTDNSKETMDQIKLFLSYHHAKGTFCYFDEDNLSNHVVLDPQFLVDAFRCVITSEKFCKVRPKMRSVWEELCNTAIIRAELFEEVWRQEKDNSFYKFKQLLIEYMQKHHIIAEALAYELESEPVVKRLGYFIVPSLLKISADDDTMRSYLEGKPLSTVSLCYKFEHETMAPFTYQACLAGIIGRWPLAKLDNTYVLFDNVAACEIEREHAGVLMLTENKLELLVVSLCPPDNVKADVCDMFRRYVEAVMMKWMRKLNANKHEGQFFSLAARCLHTDHGTGGSSGTLPIDNIQSCNYEKIRCPDGRSHCLQVRSIVKEWFMTDFKQDNVPKRKLSEKEYSTLAMAIGNGWELLGLQLGLDNITLDHIRMDKDNTAARIYEMFLKWDSKEGDQATLDVIVQAIENCNLEKVHVKLDVLKNIISGF